MEWNNRATGWFASFGAFRRVLGRPPVVTTSRLYQPVSAESQWTSRDVSIFLRDAQLLFQSDFTGPWPTVQSVRPSEMTARSSDEAVGARVREHLALELADELPRDTNDPALKALFRVAGVRSWKALASTARHVAVSCDDVGRISLASSERSRGMAFAYLPGPIVLSEPSDDELGRGVRRAFEACRP